MDSDGILCGLYVYPVLIRLYPESSKGMNERMNESSKGMNERMNEHVESVVCRKSVVDHVDLSRSIIPAWYLCRAPLFKCVPIDQIPSCHQPPAFLNTQGWRQQSLKNPTRHTTFKGTDLRQNCALRSLVCSNGARRLWLSPRSCLWLHKWVVAENRPRQSWCWLHRQIDHPFVDRQNVWQRFDLVTWEWGHVRTWNNLKGHLKGHFRSQFEIAWKALTGKGLQKKRQTDVKMPLRQKYFLLTLFTPWSGQPSNKNSYSDHIAATHFAAWIPSLMVGLEPKDTCTFRPFESHLHSGKAPNLGTAHERLARTTWIEKVLRSFSEVVLWSPSSHVARVAAEKSRSQAKTPSGTSVSNLLPWTRAVGALKVSKSLRNSETLTLRQRQNERKREMSLLNFLMLSVWAWDLKVMPCPSPGCHTSHHATLCHSFHDNLRYTTHDAESVYIVYINSTSSFDTVWYVSPYHIYVRFMFVWFPLSHQAT